MSCGKKAVLLHLGRDLKRLVDAGMIVQKLDVYYIAEDGVKFLSYYPNWEVMNRNGQRRNYLP